MPLALLTTRLLPAGGESGVSVDVVRQPRDGEDAEAAADHMACGGEHVSDGQIDGHTAGIGVLEVDDGWRQTLDGAPGVGVGLEIAGVGAQGGDRCGGAGAAGVVEDDSVVSRR